MLRVLIWAPGSSVVPGGHRVQFDHTAAALRSHGMDVNVSYDADPALDGYHVVHGLGLSPEQVRRCRVAGTTVCLSTIYWSQRYTQGLDLGMDSGRQLQRRFRLAVGSALAGARLRHLEKAEHYLGDLLRTRLAFESADLLLPNSQQEADTIQAELGVTTPASVVPNGINGSVFGQPPSSGERDIDVLYVGRIEPHKNQLGLITALAERPLRVVIVGPPHPHHEAYFRRCRDTAGPNTQFVSDTSQEDLVSFYQRAKVHALPSWFETTGLVSLEAAALGCNVVTTDRGYAREYFGSQAWYCDPAEPESIVAAITGALSAPPDPALRQQVLERYTWEAAAEATARAYELALSRRVGPAGSVSAKESG
jgi:glycosyltransferase involved in cell wall biosynthesis